MCDKDLRKSATSVYYYNILYYRIYLFKYCKAILSSPPASPPPPLSCVITFPIQDICRAYIKLINNIDGKMHYSV